MNNEGWGNFLTAVASEFYTPKSNHGQGKTERLRAERRISRAGRSSGALNGKGLVASGRFARPNCEFRKGAELHRAGSCFDSAKPDVGFGPTGGRCRIAFRMSGKNSWYWLPSMLPKSDQAKPVPATRPFWLRSG